MPQIDLFGKSIEKPKPVVITTSSGETFEELERRVALKYGRKHLGYPCDEAQDLDIDDRPSHIFNADGDWKCLKCKNLIEQLEKKI